MRAHNSKASRARAAARLAAVQALYQRDMEATHLPTLLDEFHRHRLGAEIEGDQYAQAEVAFFDDVVLGVYARLDEIDDVLTSKLAEGWTLSRLDKTMHQILRAGTYELLARPDVTTGTVINEYVDVAHAFFERREAKFVNGLLDAVAKDVR
ncbi:transcription antitermination factor NusB [Novosphingobium sp. B 225]|uniref:transcription antitermination factor NusB n=1 Tax=Novosphingobium sp. B 225 TaxID=1961849 RepID=UPI000B4ADB96|nr:transcription antitermination factor NusB [Novosphingobium sp. B 225]